MTVLYENVLQVIVEYINFVLTYMIFLFFLFVLLLV